MCELVFLVWHCSIPAAAVSTDITFLPPGSKLMVSCHWCHPVIWHWGRPREYWRQNMYAAIPKENIEFITHGKGAPKIMFVTLLLSYRVMCVQLTKTPVKNQKLMVLSGQLPVSEWLQRMHTYMLLHVHCAVIPFLVGGNNENTMWKKSLSLILQCFAQKTAPPQACRSKVPIAKYHFNENHVFVFWLVSLFCKV